MMTTISSIVVEDVLLQKERGDDADTPTTPRATRFPSNPDGLSTNIAATNLDQAHDSGPHVVAAKPEEHSQDNEPPHSTISSTTKEDQFDAMDVDDSDDELRDSDNEAEGGDGDAASRKKKGQRFFCTGYPPCNLSFTRSEHLARHIRKHTGERPFQCHCNRRFSRLDNLRQHAQTVHVNEEIPTDSLAATGTRFQRQIRTDRVRQNGRPRSGTMGSTGSHSRGHSRNLSASSVGSTSSNYSTVTEAKRRPPPLLMANDSTSRPKLGLEPPSTPPAQYRGFGPHSPGGMTTPTSATFSAAPGSPGYGPPMGSPASSTSRVGLYYGQSPRTPGRRLSVPSGPNPFQNPYPNTYSVPYMAQMGQSGSNQSSNSSLLSSPMSTTFGFGPGHHISPSDDWRRRTWHPSTYSGANLNYGRPATSGLTYSQTPDAPQPAYAHHATAAAGQAPRLPGIESFDHVQHRPSTPPRRQPSPMHIDTGHGKHLATPSGVLRASYYPELDENGQVIKPNSWGQQAIQEIRSVGTRHKDAGHSSDMGPPPSSFNTPQQQQHIAQEALQMQSSARKNKRHGWYSGPVSGTRTSPEDSSSSDGVPTPGTSAVDVHPIIMHSNGYMEPPHTLVSTESQQNACLAPPSHIASPYVDSAQHPRTTSFGERTSVGGEMNRLEALVAVATSGENATTGAR